MVQFALYTLHIDTYKLIVCIVYIYTIILLNKNNYYFNRMIMIICNNIRAVTTNKTNFSHT